MIRKFSLFLLFIILVFILFALYQNNPTPINFKFYGGLDIQILPVVLISLTFIVGMFIGYLTAYPKKRQLKKIIRQHEKQIASLKTSLVSGDQKNA